MIDDPTLPGGDGAATVDAGSGTGGATTTLPTAAGDRFGRFRVDGLLGAGGMGVVFAAHDPVLDRQVAIKVVSQRGDDTAGAALEARMLREAKAMARLTHPNVVRVYEAGSNRAGVFLVMELVEGTTLSRWLDVPRPWRAVLAKFAAAGRGLAAAHAAGLVHRDFKPANVLLGDDGRVLVSDFGLVSVKGQGDDVAASPSAAVVSDGLDLSSGAAVGTPRYMAPEQHQRGAIDPRTDQWALCASLWEALYGAHPYASDSASVMAIRVCVDDVRPPDDLRGTPAHVLAALTRGLARDAEARWPSMLALLAELERDPTRRRRRLAIGGAAVALVGVAAVGWLRVDDAPAATGPCAIVPTAPWTAAARAELEAQFRVARGDDGAATFVRVAERVDGATRGWQAAHARVCRDDDRASPEFLARVSCLARLRDDTAALLEVFARRTSAPVVDGAVAATASLPAAETCLDARTRARSLAVAPDERVAAAGVEARLQEAEALARAGLFVEAVTATDQALASARAAGVGRLEAQARLARGRALERGRRYPEAEAELRQAAQVAAGARDDDTVAAAWVALLWVVGRAQRPAEAITLAPLVAAAVERAGNPPRLRADLAFHHAACLVELGRYDESMVLLEQARAIWRDELDVGDVGLTRLLNTMGNVESYRGRHAAARALYEQVVTRREQALGLDHPDVAFVLSNLAMVDLDEGAPERAHERCVRAVEILIATPALGPGRAVSALRCRGNAAMQLGRLDDASEAFTAALAASEATTPPDDALPYVLADLAALDCERGQPALALPRLDRAEADMDNPTDRALMAVVRGRALNELGRAAEARRVLEPLVGALDRGPAIQAELELELARALWPDRTARAHARTLATAAAARLDPAGPPNLRARLDAWRRAHP